MTPGEAGQAALAECLARIDEVDRRIMGLLNERVVVVQRIGEIKQNSGLNVYEPNREKKVIENVLGCNNLGTERGPLPDEAAVRIFERIMDEMRTIQRDRMREKES